jgi:hypothetical protein
MASPGDLALVEIRRSPAGGELSEATIRRRDPVFSQPFPILETRWLSGLIRRYCADVVDISFDWRVGLDCVVPGSYAVDAIAKVRRSDGRERSITMVRAKRYDAQRFVACIAAAGWRCLAMEDEQESSFILLCKESAADRQTACEVTGGGAGQPPPQFERE